MHERARLPKALTYYITLATIKQHLFVNFYSLNDWTLERYKIRHFCLCEAEEGGFIVYTRKNALKTAEMSGKRAKTGCFPYRKQNSIAEIVSTMESFLWKGYKKDIFGRVLTGFELSHSFYAWLLKDTYSWYFLNTVFRI